jgi:prepilin-type N-terminal cleavage/methylation domain-containing protein
MAFRRSGVQAFRRQSDRSVGSVGSVLNAGPEHLNTRTPERPFRPGFTLIELMVAMTLLAIIGGGMAMAFNTSLRAAGSIRQRAEVTDERRKLIAQLRTDLEGVWLRSGSQTTWFRGGDLSSDPNEVSANPGGGSSAQGDSLELTTSRPISLDALQQGEQSEGTLGPQSDVAQVSWRLEPDTDGTLALVRRERTPPDSQVDDSQDPSVVRTVMSRSVTALQVYCYDGTQWLEQWDSALPPANTTTSPGTTGTTGTTSQTALSGLPQAVQVTLTFGRGSTGSRLPARNSSSTTDQPLTVVVPMPGAAPQTTTRTGVAPGVNG